MHRSGTSLVTKCFEVFGYGLGETLMAASDDNPKGFFEDLDVVVVVRTTGKPAVGEKAAQDTEQLLLGLINRLRPKIRHTGE